MEAGDSQTYAFYSPALLIPKLRLSSGEKLKTALVAKPIPRKQVGLSTSENAMYHQGRLFSAMLSTPNLRRSFCRLGPHQFRSPEVFPNR